MARNTSIVADIQFKNASLSRSDVSAAETVPASKIKPSPFNEGLDMAQVKEYAESMRVHGLIEPIVVYEKPGGEYEILTGHQRFEAWCKELGHDSIKAVIRPYEPDPIKRFGAHTDANKKRALNLKYWISRIDVANSVLDDTGFEGGQYERKQKLAEMLGGISLAQLYRYDSFRKLIPELQQVEANGWLSASTLYAAVALTPPQQMQVFHTVSEIHNARAGKKGEAEAEITREEFNRLVNAVKAGKKQEPNKRPSTYDAKIDRAITSLIKTIGKPKTDEQKEQAKEKIAALRVMLDEAEAGL